jgi:hypothetical protein
MTAGVDRSAMLKSFWKRNADLFSIGIAARVSFPTGRRPDRESRATTGTIGFFWIADRFAEAKRRE